jgi:HlyD family secretion protein
VTVAAAMLVTLMAIGAARVIRSPAQAAAEAAAPPPSVITVSVQRRVLMDTIVLRGMVAAEQTVDVLPRGGADTSPVVTAVRVKAGDVVDAGAILIEVSGRPVFALPGRIPAYRDLRPGSHGRDVGQLQAALRAEGFASRDPAGSYGPGTKAAVRAFYEANGYEPMPASEEDDLLLEEAQDAVTQAKRALRDAEAELRAAKQVPGASRPRNASQAMQAVADRREDYARVRQKLALAEARTGPMVPAGELLFLRRFPARVDVVHTVVGAQGSGKLLTVSAGRLVVKSQLSPPQKDLVRPGQQVKLYAEALGISARGKVRSVADTPRQPDPGAAAASGEAGDPAAPEVAGESFEMVALPTTRLDPRAAGQDVRVTVVAATTRVPVLTVPLAAVSAGADGRTTVTAVAADGTQRQVEVRPGASGDGHVQVAPIGGALRVGDHVLVGVGA